MQVVQKCFVMMHLHLILKIFVCDAWVALWIFFLEMLFQNRWDSTARLKQFTKQRFNTKYTIEK